ncbi:MAG: ABC transporter permease subunit [Nitrososphaerales archaeon]|nr:ABC transporter permease subunit [Nitrososphaerales archaeon]
MSLEFGLIAIDIAASWLRMFLALGLSVVFALAVGIAAARNRRAEGVILPLLDIFQSIPILGFFPFVIIAIYGAIPNQVGVNLAVVILIFTSMSWNIAFGVYEAVKAIPQDYADLLNLTNSSLWQRMKSMYIPASLSRIAYNTQTSWAVGLFFLVASEIISYGPFTVPVTYGIGVAVEQFTSSTVFDAANYALLIGGIIAAVVLWRYLFIREFALWSERYKMMEEPREKHRDPIMKFYSWVNQRAVSKLFLFTQGRGVSRFTSTISRFRKGLKYAVLIFLALFLFLVAIAITRSGGASLGRLPSLSTVGADELSVLYALGTSFLRVWYVYGICVAIGLPLGIVISLNFKLYDTVSPILEIISSIPAPILLPAVVLIPVLGGLPEAVSTIIIVLAIIWYIIFNVMAGVRTLPADIKDLPHVFSTGRGSAWRNVYFPGAITGFVTGSITAIGGAWNALIISEYFTVTNPTTGKITVLTQVPAGIGKTIDLAAFSGDNLTLALAVISMTVLIVAFNLTVWRRIYHYATKRYTYNY